MVVSTLTWVEGGGGKAKKESQNRDRSKRKKLSQKIGAHVGSLLKHVLSIYNTVISAVWNACILTGRAIIKRAAGYGIHTREVMGIQQFAWTIFLLQPCQWSRSLKTRLCEMMKKKKKSSDVCFHLVCCISEHGTTDTVVSSRWVADSSSGWGFSPGVDGFSITNCIRWKNMFS